MNAVALRPSRSTSVRRSRLPAYAIPSRNSAGNRYRSCILMPNTYNSTNSTPPHRARFSSLPLRMNMGSTITNGSAMATSPTIVKLTLKVAKPRKISAKVSPAAISAEFQSALLRLKSITPSAIAPASPTRPTTSSAVRESTMLPPRWKIIVRVQPLCVAKKPPSPKPPIISRIVISPVSTSGCQPLFCAR